MTSGMNFRTGRLISGKAFLMQSIELCLQTPKYTRLIEREFGSEIFYSVDRPMIETIDIFRATTEALLSLKEFRLVKTNAQALEGGRLEVKVFGVYLPTGEEVSMGVKI